MNGVSDRIGVKPKVDEWIGGTTNEVVVLTGFDEQYISGADRLATAIDLDPAFALQQTKELIVAMDMWPVLIVRHQSGTVEGETTVVDPFARQDRGKDLAGAGGDVDVREAKALHRP